MSATLFPGYADPFSVAHTSAEESPLQKFAREIRKLKKKCKKLKHTIKEKRATEKAAQTQEKSLWKRIGDAIEKAIPAICVAIASVFAKNHFSRQNETKCKCTK
jgi:predicted transcriptional regulator